jgi:hypothetical protein
MGRVRCVGTGIKLIRESMQYGHPTGSQLFTESIEKKLGIRLSLNKPGRPKKK